MENQIYNLVNKLMKIYEVEQPTLGHQWAEQLISSAKRNDHQIKPLAVSLNEIESFRKDDGIRNLCEELGLRDGKLRNVEEILHLASRLGSDDSMRKFVKIHNLLKASKAKKLQQQQDLQKQQQQQRDTHHHQTQEHYQQTPQLPHHQNKSQQQPMPSNYANLPPTRVNAETSGVNTHKTPQPVNNSTMIAITPASYRGKRSKTRRETRRKNDILHQKMKAFLADNQFLSFDFKKIDWTNMPQVQPLSSMSVQEQESALIHDLLYVLIGTEGKYIRMQPSRESVNKHTIGVERGGDELIYTSATRIIKICPLYSTVVHYAEDVNFGLVNQALAAPVRDLVKEYLSLISGLQLKALKNEITLQSMWLSLQTIFYRMEALKHILDQISRDSFYGGHTLSILHNRVVNFNTDPRTHEFCLRLMEAASEPYFEILERWLYLGVIEDPYGEFFIEDTEAKSDARDLFSLNSTLSNHCPDIDGFWRRRFSHDDSKVPEFFRTRQEKILDTGKYLSVVRHYGKKAFRPMHYQPFNYSPEIRGYDERIDEAYRFASKELLDLLLVENKLIDRLYSLKRYFLFSSGDFFVQFMDMADEELSKTKDEINKTRLESLLELALRTSSCNNDPYKDDVHIEMSDGSLYQTMASINDINNADAPSHSDYNQLSKNLLGWESFTLYYDVAWPLSIIICKDYCQTLYQMMFRHLFCCKYIERKLEATWRLNRLFKFGNYEGACALRHKMLHFVHNLLFYIIEIVEPSFQIMISKFKDGTIENVNELIELHRAFLSGLVHDSMLTDNELLGHVTKLLLLCMDFSVVFEARYAAQELEERKAKENSASRSRSINNLSSSYVASQVRKLSLSTSTNSFKFTNPEETFQSRISDINEKFNNQLKTLLNILTERSQDFTASSKLQNIFYRLDFNNFYWPHDGPHKVV